MKLLGAKVGPDKTIEPFLKRIVIAGLGVGSVIEVERVAIAPLHTFGNVSEKEQEASTPVIEVMSIVPLMVSGKVFLFEGCS